MKINAKKQDKTWLNGYNDGYKDAVADALCGLVEGVAPLKETALFTDMIGKVISVDWRDSNIYFSQEEKNYDFKVATMTSIGKLIHSDSSKIVIAGDIVDEEVRRVIVIPKENIIGLSYK